MRRPEIAADAEYSFTVRPRPADEGGGYLIEFPSLPGCMAEGETVEKAIAKGRNARDAWIAAMREAGRPVPAPGDDPNSRYSGKWQVHTTKTMHRTIVERARREGVSLNTLAVSLLAEALGSRKHQG